jgi:hypothetical protein
MISKNSGIYEVANRQNLAGDFNLVSFLGLIWYGKNDKYILKLNKNLYRLQTSFIKDKLLFFFNFRLARAVLNLFFL